MSLAKVKPPPRRPRSLCEVRIPCLDSLVLHDPSGRSATTATIHAGDCLDVLRGMADSSVDSIVTDPPYGLEFMGKDWDAPWKTDRRQTFDGTLADTRDNPFSRGKVRYGMGASYGGKAEHMQAFQTWATEIFAECLRVLKPGGHLLSFGGSRTYHRMACAIEDAGFEVRDCIMWLYGSGFPKSRNLNGEWQGWGTALKPAHEPIVVARKPLAGTVATNVLAHGTGALNIDGCRVATDEKLGGGAEKATTVDQKGNDGWVRPWMEDPVAREAHAARVRSNVERAESLGRFPANVIHDGSDEVVAAFPDSNGSAARFFYCAKASKADRGADNRHPTVKPTALMRYLCRLVTPPGGTVLDPFTGSGSTGKAAILEGFRFIGIEREAEYVAIAQARCEHAATTVRAERVKADESTRQAVLL